MTPQARSNRHLNPGNGWVSKLCHEPKVGLAVLKEMLAPYVSNGRITVLLKHRPINAATHGNQMEWIQVKNIETSDVVELKGAYFLDATECGDVLPLVKAEYVVGAESQTETSEPDALAEADPTNMQSFTMCFAMDYLEGENHVIARPTDYDFWRNYRPDFWPDKLLSWTHPFPPTLEPWSRDLFYQPGRSIRIPVAVP